MARPTTDKKDYKVILRVNNKTRAKIEEMSKQMGCSMSECVRKIVEGEGMASTKTQAKGIRIANECADYFDGKPLNRMVESLMLLLLSGEITFDGVNLNISGKDGVHTFKKDKTYADLEEMVFLCGGTMDEFMKDIDRCMSDGSLTISNGKLVCVLPDWAERLSEACHEIGYDVEQIVDSAIKSLKKGGL